jgi:hypothetical protein
MNATRYLPPHWSSVDRPAFRDERPRQPRRLRFDDGDDAAVGLLLLPPLAFVLAVALELGGGLPLIIPQQLRRPDPGDPLPQDPHDGRWSASDHGARGGCHQSRRTPFQEPRGCCQRDAGPLTSLDFTSVEASAYGDIAPESKREAC